MKELIPSRSDHDLADFSGRKGIDTIFWRATFTIPKKKLAKTSKTGLKLHQKLLLIPSPERTGYRKSYLAWQLRQHWVWMPFLLPCTFKFQPSWQASKQNVNLMILNLIWLWKYSIAQNGELSFSHCQNFKIKFIKCWFILFQSANATSCKLESLVI